MSISVDAASCVYGGKYYTPGTDISSACTPTEVYLPAGPAQDYRPQLFVYLVGTGGSPSDAHNILRTAAYAGYRSIGMSYDNIGSIASRCIAEGKPSCSDQCGLRMRRVTISGVNDPGLVWQIDPQDSISTRLVKALTALYDEDQWDNVSDFDWEDYIVVEQRQELNNTLWPGASATEAVLNWQNIVIAGFSQGAGHAVLISMDRLVAGVAALEGGNDRCVDPTGATAMASYLTTRFNQSRNQPRFAARHADNFMDGESGAPHHQPEWFPLHGFDITSHPVDLLPTPLTSNVVVTSQNVPSEAGCSEHKSVAVDQCMPTDASLGDSSSASGLDADDAHLFAAYLEGLCSLD